MVLIEQHGGCKSTEGVAPVSLGARHRREAPLVRLAAGKPLPCLVAEIRLEGVGEDGWHQGTVRSSGEEQQR